MKEFCVTISQGKPFDSGFLKPDKLFLKKGHVILFNEGFFRVDADYGKNHAFEIFEILLFRLRDYAYVCTHS